MPKQPKLRIASTLMRTQRQPEKSKNLEVLFHHTLGQLRRYWSANLRPYRRLLVLIKAKAEEFSVLNDEQFEQSVAQLKGQLRQQGISEALLVRAYACVREAAGRSLGMYHFDSQLLGGLAIFRGNIAEMQTGEGKTLTAVLPAATAALAGVPVHVITVNDYLTSRDAQEMTAVYQCLGLTLGCVIEGMDILERQQAYACDVVYCTNNELVFDYLKDSLVLKDSRHPLQRHSARIRGKRNMASKLMLRGLHFAVVDEADSVLLDEARTPLVITGEVEANPQQLKTYQEAIIIAGQLQQDEHFLLDAAQRQITLLEASEKTIEHHCASLSSYWIGRVKRLELIHKALMALYLFKPNIDYLIVDAKIQIIDESTGRVMPDRSWEVGLHQMIETKEGVEPSNPRQTLTRISYQRFFRFYHHLGGMTGTAKEVASELWSIYSLPVVSIPTHKPSRRLDWGKQMFFNREQQWQALIGQIEQLHSEQRSVLVGTASVEVSEALSQALQQENIPHQVLNAKNNEQEAQMITRAGQMGEVTIATSMAGRGTDIKLSARVVERGGLHVILTQYQDSSRIDRQLAGRCGRQGDPGSFEIMLALSDTRIASLWASLLITFLQRSSSSKKWIDLQQRLGLWLLRYEQKQLEKQHAYSRRQLLKTDERQNELLAFTSSQF
jgi:preprotein translocase subunit SecA